MLVTDREPVSPIMRELGIWKWGEHGSEVGDVPGGGRVCGRGMVGGSKMAQGFVDGVNNGGVWWALEAVCDNTGGVGKEFKLKAM